MKPTLTLTIHCCRFPRFFRKPVRSSWCLQSSVNQHVLKKLIRTKFEVMAAAFQGSSEKIHVVWYEYLSRNILFVTKLYNALSTARIQDVPPHAPPLSHTHTQNSTLIHYPNQVEDRITFTTVLMNDFCVIISMLYDFIVNVHKYDN